mgnify:FL=1
MPQVTVGASVNLIDDVFQNLTTLYFKNPVKVSAQYVIGQLLGTEAAHDKLIGSVVPLATLESLCESAVSYSDILVRCVKFHVSYVLRLIPQFVLLL